MLTFLVVIGASFAIMASILTGMVSSTLYQQRTRQATRSLEQLASSAAPFLASAQMDSLSELLTAQAGELGGRLLAVEVIRTEERNRILHFCMDEMNPDYREGAGGYLRRKERAAAQYPGDGRRPPARGEIRVRHSPRRFGIGCVVCGGRVRRDGAKRRDAGRTRAVSAGG